MSADSGEHQVPRLTPPFVKRTETPPVGGPAQPVIQPPYARAREAVPVAETLPSISEYLYAPGAEPVATATATVEATPAPPAEPPRQPSRTPEKLEHSGSWVLGEWQRLESQRADAGTATIEADSELAQEAWSDLDWEEDVGRNRRKRPAEMVATILDRVARKIRAGEIRVAGTPGMSEEAALAAALSALLGVRRP